MSIVTEFLLDENAHLQVSIVDNDRNQDVSSGTYNYRVNIILGIRSPFYLSTCVIKDWVDTNTC